MKKLIISLILFLFIVPIICSCSCNPVPSGYYIVRYVIDGEELYSAYAVRGEIIGMPVLDDRESYVFKGWYLTDEYIEKWDFENDTVTKSLSLYGYWVAENEETFNILYYNDAELINYEKVPKGNCASEFLPPDKTGYDFQGWLQKNKKYDFNEPLTDDIILNAEWKAITYTVTFIADNETVSVLSYTIEDKNLKPPDVPQKEHYTGEWQSFKLSLENIEVTAVYTPIVYNATFIADGTEIKKIKYTVEDTVISPEVPLKKGYTGEWVGLPVEGGNITITAEYTPVIYTVTYKVFDTTVKTVEYTIETIDKIIPPEVPVIQGYLGKWEEQSFDSLGDITVNAVYTIMTYTATFIADGKIIEICSFQLDKMQVEEPEIPKKDGYTAKWEDYNLVSEDIIINAVYTPITYTADFYIGSEKVESVNFTIEDADLQVPDVEEWQGYSVKWEPVKISANNLIINAVLTPITYFVTFIADETEIIKVEYTVQNININVPLPPQKFGFTVKWEDFTLTYGNVTVNAVYTPVPDEELNFKDEFDYQTETDGSLTVTGYHGKENYLYIPSMHNDIPIKTIGKGAFSGSAISGIKFNDGVEIIADEAFLNCENLIEVILPDTLKSIGKYAFAYCGFSEINLPDSISEINKQAFSYSSVKSIILPKSLTELDDAFSYCADLESIALNGNLSALRANIFSGCSSLKSIAIPENIKIIEANAFADTVLESVAFADVENWTIYSANDDEILNVDYSQLTDQSIAAKWLTKIYISRYWKNSKNRKALLQ